MIRAVVLEAGKSGWEDLVKAGEIDEKETYERYYPLMRVRLDTENLCNMVKAILLNDELYEHCKELAVKYSRE